MSQTAETAKKKKKQAFLKHVSSFYFEVLQKCKKKKIPSSYFELLILQVVLVAFRCQSFCADMIVIY